MDPKKLFADERFTGICAYCGGNGSTRDHVPSRVLLDEPYPSNLPVVPACSDCNNGFSLDEEYLACLIECAITGSVEPEFVSRSNVKRILQEKPALASLLAASRESDANGNLLWRPDLSRVQHVILKLARGHAAYEYSEPQLFEPASISFMPISLMSGGQLRSFETPSVELLWPEIGSRAFLNSLKNGSLPFESDWKIVQQRRYRYSVSHSERISVRMVLSEYLACEVLW